MQICCTKDLQKELGITSGAGTEEKDLFCWSAHVFTVNRRKTVAVFNDRNRFGFVLYGLKAKDLQNFKELLLEGIRNSLLDEKIKLKVVEKYLETAGDITFAKTRGPKYVGRVNRACEVLRELYDNFDPSMVYQTSASKWINNDLVRLDKKSDYEHPCVLIIKDLESFADTGIIH